jgi:hypothetical protein
MSKIKGLLIAFFAFVTFDGFGQRESRVNDIKQLYKEYNESLSQMDNYEIKYHTAGSYPSLTIFTDYSGKLLIKTEDADELGFSYSEYYFKNDTIQFIFFKSERLLDHWGADTVRFKKLELRFYFDNGQVFKALKKDFIGVEGKDDKVDLTSIKNTEIDYMTDYDANWLNFRDRYKIFIKLYIDLQDTF